MILPQPKLDHVSTLNVSLDPIREMGAGRAGARRIIPIVGGTVALADLREISFARTNDGGTFWRLTSHEPQPLIIPAGASGVDVLLDTFTALPQFDTGLMVRAVQSRTPTARIIWHHPAHGRTLKALT